MVGDDICIVVTSIRGGGVRIGVEAPRGISVDREELWKKRHDVACPTLQCAGS
jgi:carbon storage regulator